MFFQPNRLTRLAGESRKMAKMNIRMLDSRANEAIHYPKN
jgi:hypothetical protein